MRHSFSLFTYRLLLILLFPIVITVALVRSVTQQEYRYRLSERLGFLPRGFKKNGVVIHAASVGEVIALKPFIEQLLVTRPELPLTITTFTPTGSAQVKKLFEQRVQHCYLPLDIYPCTWLFLKKLRPQALVFMETELWPNLISQCHSHNIKLQLINARLSQHSMKNYRKVMWLMSPTLRMFDSILTQSDVNRDNFIALGALPEQCHVSGNLKYDLQVDDKVNVKLAKMEANVVGSRTIWLVASTHEGDEAIALTSFHQLKKRYTDLLLVLVPRHPERFDTVYRLCVDQQLSTIRRSSAEQVTDKNDIWLIDSLGELLASCGLADIVTMGGSFSSIGGHNPLEPALFKKPIIVGHDMSNFAQVMEQLSSQMAVLQLPTNSDTTTTGCAEQLTIAIKQLLSDHESRITMGERAYQVVQKNQGASERSVNALVLLLS